MSSNQENLFFDYIRRLEHHRQGRELVHVHLSKLRPFNRREHHIRVAADAFEGMVKELLGQVFVLKSADILFVFKTEASGQAEQAIDKIKFLFGDDPLLLEDTTEGKDFHTWYDVGQDYDAVVALARGLIRGGEEDRDKRPSADGRAALEAKQQDGEKITPRTLDRLIDALKAADLTNMIRRQYICSLEGPQLVPQPKFSELFISISDLREALMPEVNMMASPWLFQHLTETLDRRVLSMLSKTEDRDFTGDISINLNVTTLLSPEFLKFDENVIAAMRGNIVLELQHIDIFSDLNAYLFAREFVKDRGYKICIDGVRHTTLPFIDRDRLDADMIKLIWHPDIVHGGQDVTDMVKRQLLLTGPARVVLSRCDSEEAIDFGRDMGLEFFQGRHVESLIAEENRRKNLRKLKQRTTAQDQKNSRMKSFSRRQK